jgi:SNF2 family DNA or RNA helicase
VADMRKKVLPKHLTDIEAIELIYGPPERTLTYGDFRPYQRWMTKKVKELDAVYLGAEMGLGKTGAVLKAIVDLLGSGEIKQVLIIAPVRVTEETWPEEIAKWDFARKLRYRVVTGDAEERKAALRYTPAEVTIVNRENLRWLLNTLGIKRWNFDMIVYDEASRLKSGELRSSPSKRADGTMPPKRMTELGVLNRMRFRTRKIVELSGTPAPNGLIDLWGPIYALDAGRRLGDTRTAYKRRWFREDLYKRTIEPFDHSEKEIMEKLDGIFFSLKEEDYLKLPPMIPVDHWVTLSDEEMAGYRKFERETAIELMNRQGEREVIEAVNRGVLTGKLLQYANGSLYTGDKFDEDTGKKMPRESIKIHERKLDVLESIVEEASGRPILVAYSFQFDKDAIKKRFPYARIFGENRNDMRDWNAGKIKLLVTHPAAAGHGLNFQFGSNIAVWYGLTWSLELYRQFIKRLHRSGQAAQHVYLHRIMAKRTADENIIAALMRRGVVQDNITDAVRVRLEQAI